MAGVANRSPTICGIAESQSGPGQHRTIFDPFRGGNQVANPSIGGNVLVHKHSAPWAGSRDRNEGSSRIVWNDSSLPLGCRRRSKSPGIVSRQQDFAESEKRADRARFGPRCGIFGDSGPRGTPGRFVIRPSRYLQRGLGMTAEPMPNSMRPASQTLVPKPTPSAASCIWSVTAKARKP